MDLIMNVVMDTILDSLRLFPFLFLTYLLMEFLEHHTSDRVVNFLKKSGKFGPPVGAISGAVPQCGFSAAASNLYAGRVITLGTLMAVYLATSDEMLPMMLTAGMNLQLIGKIILFKVVVGLVIGVLIDTISHIFHRSADDHLHIHEMCEDEHCHCEDGILKSALKHSLQILLFIFLLSLVINYFMEYIGIQGIQYVTIGRSYFIIFLASLAGLIPSCGASVAITQLYISGLIGEGALLAGLLVGAGVGILVLLRVNKKPLENVKIIAILWAVGFLVGCLVKALHIVF